MLNAITFKASPLPELELRDVEQNKGEGLLPQEKSTDILEITGTETEAEKAEAEIINSLTSKEDIDEKTFRQKLDKHKEGIIELAKNKEKKKALIERVKKCKPEMNMKNALTLIGILTASLLGLAPSLGTAVVLFIPIIGVIGGVSLVLALSNLAMEANGFHNSDTKAEYNLMQEVKESETEETENKKVLEKRNSIEIQAELSKLFDNENPAAVLNYLTKLQYKNDDTKIAALLSHDLGDDITGRTIPNEVLLNNKYDEARKIIQIAESLKEIKAKQIVGKALCNILAPYFKDFPDDDDSCKIAANYIHFAERFAPDSYAELKIPDNLKNNDMYELEMERLEKKSNKLNYTRSKINLRF